MTELPDLPATALLAGYRDGSLSPVAVTQAVLARIEAWDARLGATWAMDPEGALAAARRSEARWQRGEPTGALDGVPITVKENLASRGTAMPLGTAASELVPAAEDSPPVARVREAGAVLLGRTSMPDYGMLSSGVSSFHRLARNPWDLSRGPGGSSAGAGAAAAAGYGPLHLGTDIGGSVRLPAGWCGVVGLKPSFGRVPIDPPFLGRVAGPLTRTVADAALLMSVLSRPDARDPMALPPATLDWSCATLPLRGLRLGLCLDAGVGLPVHPEVAAAVRAAAAALEAEGAVVTAVAPLLTRAMLDGLDRFWQARFWSDLAVMAPGRRDRVLPYIRAWAARADGLSGTDVYRGFAQIDAMRAACLGACRGLDYLLTPTAPIPAFAAELPGPTNDPATPFEHIGFTVGFNMSEQPAASIGCGHTAGGLPIGLQIVGARFDDVGVLRLAAAWEAMRPPQPAWPRVAGL